MVVHAGGSRYLAVAAADDVNGPLRRIRRDPEAEAHQTAKHGREGELWVNPELGWGFVLVPQTPMPVMVTAYAMTERGRA